MTFQKADIRYLKWPLLVFLSALGFGSAAIVVSKDFAARARGEIQGAQSQLDAARANFAAAEEDRKNMTVYLREYGELAEHGIIGEGQQLDWIENMEKIRRLHRVLNFSYTLSRQHLHTQKIKAGRGRFDLNMSDMALQIELLHEGQLMNFIDQLRAAPRGKFILNNCAMERADDASATALLRASCAGSWLTLSRKDAT